MPRTKNVPRRSEGGAVPDQQRAAAALTAAPVPYNNALQVAGGTAGVTGVTIKEEVEEEEEEVEDTLEGQRQNTMALAPGPARVPACGPRAALAAASTPATHHEDAPAAGGSGGSGVTLVKEEVDETLAQQRDRLARTLAHGPVRVDSRIKVEDTTSGEDTDGDEDGEGEVGPGGEGGDGEEEEGLGAGEVGLVGLRTSERPTGDAGEHLAGAPLLTGRLGRSGGEAMSQPATTCLTRLPPSGTVEARELALLGATA